MEYHSREELVIILSSGSYCQCSQGQIKNVNVCKQKTCWTCKCTGIIAIKNTRFATSTHCSRQSMTSESLVHPGHL